MQGAPSKYDLEKYPSIEKIKYVGQAADLGSPCIVPTSPTSLTCAEPKQRSSYRVNRSRRHHHLDPKKSPQDNSSSPSPTTTESATPKSQVEPSSKQYTAGALVGMYLRQIGKSIVAPIDSTLVTSSSSSSSSGKTTSYEPKSSPATTTPLRRTKVSPTQESPCKSAFGTTGEPSSEQQQESNEQRKHKRKTSAGKRKNRRRGKSDLGYVESFSIDEPSTPTSERDEKEDNNKEPAENNSRLIENELQLLDGDSESFGLYEDYYKKAGGVERQDSFGSDSAVGTMKSDFFADIDLAKIRDGSSAILQELCRGGSGSDGCANRAASPFESTAL